MLETTLTSGAAAVTVISSVTAEIGSTKSTARRPGPDARPFLVQVLEAGNWASTA